MLLALLLAPAVQAADGSVAVAERALAALDDMSLDGWAFTETTNRNGTEIRLRYDPGRPDGARWTLMSVDGRRPTEKEIERYLKGRERRHGGNGEEGEAEERSAVIGSDSLTLLEESATHLVFSFRPAPDDEKDDEARAFNEHVEGIVRINKSGPYVESIEMRSREPFSPAFSVKVKEFSTIMTFSPVGDEGAVLPESVDVDMKGRAMLFKKIDEKVRTRYGDYEFVGERD